MTTVTHIPDGVRHAIEQALQLRQASPEGKEIRFLAPCHDDQDPSARWNPDKGTWYCDVCKKGGGYKHLAQQLGLSLPTNGNGQPTRRIVTTYDYRDEHNELLYQVVRYEPKDFRQRRPNGKGGFTWDLNGVRAVVYRLPDLPGHARVYDGEGEKNADRLWDEGLAATCNSGGAGKWTEAHAQQVNASGVQEMILLPNNDEAGRAHVQAQAQSCVSAGLVVKIVALPNLPPKGDVSNWFDAGGTKNELNALADTAPSWVPEGANETDTASLPEDHQPLTNEPLRLTDVGNGQLFAQQHRDNIYYCYPLKAWFVRNVDSLWERCPGNLVMQLAKATVASLYDLVRHEVDDARRIKLAAHAVKSESAQRLQSMIDLARSEPDIAISPNAFDRDLWLFSVANGVLELKTGTFRPRRREDLITKHSPVRFDPYAVCPIWLRFLGRIFHNDQRLITYLQQLAGYSLTGVTIEQAFFLLWGSGSNGKSTLLKLLLAIWGDYGLQVPAATFLSQKDQDGRARPDLVQLRGARLAVAIESDDGSRLAEGTIKQMVGGDRISARDLYSGCIEFEPTHKILFATNHKPRVKDTTHGMWRKVRLIPFEVQIPDDEQDQHLAETLLTELPGILNWALAGCLAWQAAGRLRTPEVVTLATQTYRAEQDILDDFLQERCVVEPQARMPFADVRTTYLAWISDAGDKPMSSKALAACLTERGFQPTKHRNVRHYSGLRLREARDEVAEAPAPVGAATRMGDADVDFDA